MSRPVTIAWATQALGPDGWQDAQTVDLTAFCCPGCQADWLAAHPGATDPVPLGPGRRGVGQPVQWLDETGYDLWCAACGVLVQVGLDEPPCPTWSCPPVVVNRLRSAEGERCGVCGRWQQLPTRLLDRPGARR